MARRCPAAMATSTGSMPDPTDEPGTLTADEDRTGHPRFRAFVELFALCGFALTQPLLDVFGRGVEQFAFRGASPAQIVLFGLAVTFLPALGLWLVEMAVRLVLGARPAAWVHLVFIVVLVAVFVMQAARPLGNGIPLVVGAILLGVGAGVAYARFPAVHLWLAFAALAPLGFLFLFLTSSSTSRLLRGRRGRARRRASARPAPVVMVVLDELPSGVAAGQRPWDRSRAVPQPRGAGRRLALVPQHDDGEHQHLARRARHHDRADAAG